jgi:hypothetical protein
VEAFYDTVFGSVLLRKLPLAGGHAAMASAPANALGDRSQVGVNPGTAPGATAVAASTAPQQGQAPDSATSAPAQVSARPQNVISDPTQLAATPRGKLVLQDAV